MRAFLVDRIRVQHWRPADAAAAGVPFPERCERRLVVSTQGSSLPIQ